MKNLSEKEKSYVAGFLDGDGCIMFQLIRRKDNRYGYEIRASIVFYQHENNLYHLKWLKKFYRVGYIRKRDDKMLEYTIVGLKKVMPILKSLYPYLRLKKPHAKLALKIESILSGKVNLRKFIKAAQLVDSFGKINFSKKRINTSEKLIKFLRNKNLI